MTLKENILFGNPEASEDDIYEALKASNAYDFVMKLDNKLETIVGG